jgi:hypothetical protein
MIRPVPVVPPHKVQTLPPEELGDLEKVLGSMRAAVPAGDDAALRRYRQHAFALTHARLRQHFKQILAGKRAVLFQDKSNPRVQAIYSKNTRPGEGEHRLTLMLGNDPLGHEHHTTAASVANSIANSPRDWQKVKAYEQSTLDRGAKLGAAGTDRRQQRILRSRTDTRTPRDLRLPNPGGERLGAAAPAFPDGRHSSTETTLSGGAGGFRGAPLGSVQQPLHFAGVASVNGGKIVIDPRITKAVAKRFGIKKVRTLRESPEDLIHRRLAGHKDVGVSTTPGSTTSIVSHPKKGGAVVARAHLKSHGFHVGDIHTDGKHFIFHASREVPIHKIGEEAAPTAVTGVGIHLAPRVGSVFHSAVRRYLRTKSRARGDRYVAAGVNLSTARSLRRGAGLPEAEQETYWIHSANGIPLTSLRMAKGATRSAVLAQYNASAEKDPLRRSIAALALSRKQSGHKVLVYGANGKAREIGEALQGGKGDGKKVTDFDPEQLAMGVEVEMEHTDDSDEALQIAMDHLTEDPEYYTKLKKAGLADELKKDEAQVPFTPATGSAGKSPARHYVTFHFNQPLGDAAKGEVRAILSAHTDGAGLTTDEDGRDCTHLITVGQHSRVGSALHQKGYRDFTLQQHTYESVGEAEDIELHKRHLAHILGLAKHAPAEDRVRLRAHADLVRDRIAAAKKKKKMSEDYDTGAEQGAPATMRISFDHTRDVAERSIQDAWIHALNLANPHDGVAAGLTRDPNVSEMWHGEIAFPSVEHAQRAQKAIQDATPPRKCVVGIAVSKRPVAAKESIAEATRDDEPVLVHESMTNSSFYRHRSPLREERDGILACMQEILESAGFRPDDHSAMGKDGLPYDYVREDGKTAHMLAGDAHAEQGDYFTLVLEVKHHDDAVHQEIMERIGRSRRWSVQSRLNARRRRKQPKSLRRMITNRYARMWTRRNKAKVKRYRQFYIDPPVVLQGLGK